MGKSDTAGHRRGENAGRLRGDAREGGRAVVVIDGERQGPLPFRSHSRTIDFGQELAFETSVRATT